PAVPGLGLRYVAYVQGGGESKADDGGYVGTRTQGKALEAFWLELRGTSVAEWDVFYSSSIRNVGDTPWFSNGSLCGSRGGPALEGIKVKIVPRVAAYQSIESMASSRTGKSLLITVPQNSADASVKVSAPISQDRQLSDRQLWDIRPMKGGQG